MSSKPEKLTNAEKIGLQRLLTTNEEWLRSFGADIADKEPKAIDGVRDWPGGTTQMLMDWNPVLRCPSLRGTDRASSKNTDLNDFELALRSGKTRAEILLSQRGDTDDPAFATNEDTVSTQLTRLFSRLHPSIQRLHLSSYYTYPRLAAAREEEWTDETKKYCDFAVE